MKVLFIGDTPSRFNISKHIAFLGTRSGATLDNWASVLNVDYQVINSDDPEILFSTIRWAEKVNMPVIPLGVNAAKRVTAMCYKHGLALYRFDLPHPSGRNRKLNNKEWLNDVLKECKFYLDNMRTL